MTEYKELVEETYTKLQAEEWAKGIKYIHANNGIIETKMEFGFHEIIEKINNFPLSRAARIDKLNLNILQETLLSYISGTYEKEIPFWSMLGKTQKELLKRAKFIENNQIIKNIYIKNKLINFITKK